jgi:hypothetical protein
MGPGCRSDQSSRRQTRLPLDVCLRNSYVCTKYDVLLLCTLFVMEFIREYIAISENLQKHPVLVSGGVHEIFLKCLSTNLWDRTVQCCGRGWHSATVCSAITTYDVCIDMISSQSIYRTALYNKNWIRTGPPYPHVCRKRNRKRRGPVSQQVWHDRDPSLLKGPERRA